MSGVSIHRVHDRPLKMAMHKSLAQVPMSFCAIKLVHQIAAMADPICELLEAYRSGEIDRRLPAWPHPDDWQRFYRDHQALTVGIDTAFPGMLDFGGLNPQEAMDTSRAVSLAARIDPEAVKVDLRRMGTEEQWRRTLQVGIRWQVRDYKRNLLKIGRELQAAEYDEHPGDFDQVLRQHPAIYFYLRVVLPGFLVFQTIPIRELRRLRLAVNAADQAKAVERLVRMDPQAEALEEVRGWINADDGSVR